MSSIIIYRVRWEKAVDKQLQRIPSHIRSKFQAWVLAVEEVGLVEVRKLKGFHDEPLKGKRLGQRSIRLSKSYRAIYTELKETGVVLVEVLEVNKHEY